MRLNGILQGVSLKGEIQNFLDFVKDDGTSFKLAVPEETVKILLAEIYGSEGDANPAPSEPPEKPDEPEVPEFGGDVEPDEPEEEEEEPDDDFPRSEEEIRSV